MKKKYLSICFFIASVLSAHAQSAWSGQGVNNTYFNTPGVNVSIGTNSTADPIFSDPSLYAFTVKGRVDIVATDNAFTIYGGTNYKQTFAISHNQATVAGAAYYYTSIGAYNVGTGVRTNLILQPNAGSVGIGTKLVNNPNNYTLAVNGVIGCKDFIVETSSSTFPDYVFADDYKLASLDEVEKYISDNHHLPEIPSATEVGEKGIELAEMDKLLLKKVEELTLHIIEYKKQMYANVNALKAENIALKPSLLK